MVSWNRTCDFYFCLARSILGCNSEESSNKDNGEKCRFYVLVLCLVTLRDKGLENVYPAVELPLQIAQTAAIMEVSCSSSFIQRLSACRLKNNKHSCMLMRPQNTNVLSPDAVTHHVWRQLRPDYSQPDW